MVSAHWQDQLHVKIHDTRQTGYANSKYGLANLLDVKIYLLVWVSTCSNNMKGLYERNIMKSALSHYISFPCENMNLQILKTDLQIHVNHLQNKIVFITTIFEGWQLIFTLFFCKNHTILYKYCNTVSTQQYGCSIQFLQHIYITYINTTYIIGIFVQVLLIFALIAKS